MISAHPSAGGDRLAFHLAAPAGHWINDPNALFFADGRYHLLMQHSAGAAPGAIGWGAASSADLLHWRWDGVVIPADGHGQAWSGSRCDKALWFTRHDDASGTQTQHCRRCGHDSPPIGPRGRNCRDPFVWRTQTGLAMVVARPCDWQAWANGPASLLEHWHSRDGVAWQMQGQIGPWSPPGVLWEVPVLLRLGGRTILILSQVDRRQGHSDCRVVWWAGTGLFTPDAGQPAEGWPLDLGPDFYAAIVNDDDGWPLPKPHLVAWAGNWATARAMAWPGNSHGGPITLPRALAWTGGRLRQQPLAAAPAQWHGSLAAANCLVMQRGPAGLAISIAGDGSARVRRWGSPLLDWARTHPPGTLAAGASRALTVFADGPLIEIFIEPDGQTLTAALPGDGALAITTGPTAVLP